MRYYIRCKCHLKDTNEIINFVEAVSFKYGRYRALFNIDNLSEKDAAKPLIMSIYNEDTIEEALENIRKDFSKYNYTRDGKKFFFFTRKPNQKKNITFEFFPIKVDSSKQTLFKVGKKADTSKYNENDYNIKINIAELSACSPGNK